ncbi:phosphate import ATP-binding protein PstB [Clostridia bacterium]|nr:phosphate import ATP-binding protein PstB [Clostridia bacterium]
MAKISIRGLNVFYQKKQVIRDLNLDIPENEITAVFGPANSGITTLLRSLNRLCDLTPEARVEGEILLSGKNIYDPDVRVTGLRRRVGMVFEVPSPLPLSIFENVVYGARLGGMMGKRSLDGCAERALRAAALWDEVKDRLGAPAASLSGGQQQRLCIARVLALEPEVILLDRACSGLDPISTAKIEDSLRSLKDRLTVVIAPHNVQQAGRVSDRAAFMLMGELVEAGAATEVFANPKDKRTNDYITGRFG